ncbi:Fatty acid amide hydrolase [Linum perenne]
MGNKKTMVPVGQMDLSTVKYEPQVIQAPHLTGNVFRFFLKLLESPIIGPLLLSHLKKENKMIEMLRCTVIPEPPMFVPEYPPQGPESCVVPLEEDGKPEGRVELALKTLPQYDPATYLNVDSTAPFRHWRIRDYAHAYRSKLITPSVVAEHVISAIEESRKSEPHQPLLISFDAAEVREQAAGSTQRFEEGGTTWLHKVRSVKRDAVCVSRLRSCGAIFVGKANMHELGMGTTGNNSNYGRRSMHHYLEAFKKVDVIVTPTTGMTAPVIPPSALKYGETDIKVTAYLMRFVVGPNLLGFPAISVPVGYDKKGLPIGLQLIGRPWAEATILRLAFAIEQLFAESKKKPVLFHNVLKPN